MALHRAMIVEMVVTEVGEGRRLYRQAFGAILVEAVARRLERRMGDALGGEARHVRQKGDDVGRRQPGRSTLQRDRKSTPSELQSLMRISYAVFGLKKQKTKQHIPIR